MDSTIYPLFSTPVYMSKVNLDVEYKKNLVENTDFTRISTNDGHISVNKYILNDDNFIGLKEQIEQHIDIFLRDDLKVNENQKLYLTNSWMMKHSKGDYSPIHNHQHSIISGIVYLKCDEDSGELNFHKETTAYNIFPPIFDFDYDEWNILNSSSWTISPKENQIILFPSIMSHSVEMSKSNQSRFCVAFNTFVKGEFGLNEADLMSRLSL